MALANRPFSKRPKSEHIGGLSKCLLCGKKRREVGFIEKAHLSSIKKGGTVTFPACPKCHHRYDSGEATNRDLMILGISRRKYRAGLPNRKKKTCESLEISTRSSGVSDRKPTARISTGGRIAVLPNAEENLMGGGRMVVETEEGPSQKWVRNCTEELNTLTSPTVKLDVKNWAVGRLGGLVINSPLPPCSNDVSHVIERILDFVEIEVVSADTQNRMLYLRWLETLFHMKDARLSGEIRKRFVTILDEWYDPTTLDSYQVQIRNFLQKLKGYHDTDFWIKMVDDPLMWLQDKEVDIAISNTDLRTLNERNPKGFQNLKNHLRSIVNNPQTGSTVSDRAKRWLDRLSQLGL